MTMLDDYEVRYKTRGVRNVSDMLDNVPPELLRRTGMNDLIFTVKSLFRLASRRGTQT